MVKKLIVTHPGCGACRSVREKLKDAFSAGTVREVSVTTDEGYNIAKKLGLNAVPQCVIDNEDGTYGFCSISELMPPAKPTAVGGNDDGEDSADVQ
jgi:hypothetical protein